MTNTPPLQQLQLGEALYQQGHYAKAAEIFQELHLSSPREALWSLRCSLYVARCHHKLWQDEQAEAQYLYTIKRGQEALGEPHALVADALDGLGKLLLEVQAPQRAAGFLEEAHGLRQLAFGAEHPDTAESLLHLAELYTALGQSDSKLLQRARPFYEESIRISRALLGEDPRTAAALNCFGYFHWKTRALSQARALLEEARDMEARLLPREHPSRGSSLWNLALIHRDQGELTQATALLEEALSLFANAFGLSHPKAYCALLALGELYRLAGRSQDAQRLYARALRPTPSPIADEARAFVAALKATSRTPKAFAWRGQGNKAWRFTQPARHLSLSAQALVVTTSAGAHTYHLPTLRYQGFAETQLAQEAYLTPEGALYVLTPERMLHLWSQATTAEGVEEARYQAYQEQLPHGPLLLLAERGLALCVEGQSLSLRSLKDKEELAQVTIISDGGEILPPVSAAQNLMAVGCLTGAQVGLYQLASLEELDSLETPEGVSALCFSAGGTLYVATPGWVYVYQRGPEDEVRSWGWAIQEASPQLIAASPDDALLAVSSAQGVQLYDTRAHQPLASYPTGPLEQLLFHPTFKLLFTLSQAQQAEAWAYS